MKLLKLFQHHTHFPVEKSKNTFLENVDVELFGFMRFLVYIGKMIRMTNNPSGCSSAKASPPNALMSL